MEKLSIKDIQGISLNILKDVHTFCLSNDITYFLAYGTLLGAIRHKGFIPWDDDIDICMPRPEYERFVKSYTSKRYKIMSQYENNCLIPFSRVYDDIESYVETSRPWYKSTKHNYKTGIWIDIFPIDGLLPDSEKEETRKKEIAKAESRLYKYRLSLEEINFVKRYKLRYLFGVFYHKFYRFINYSNEKKSIADNLIKIQYEASLLCADYSIISDYSPFSKDCFRTCFLGDFEDTQFFIPIGYDTLLKIWYGDYMSLPPIADRMPKQSYIDFYRKSN